MKKEYRIRVEERPGEDFKRFYPEVKVYKGKTVYHDWVNTMSPLGTNYYLSKEECVDHLKELSCEYTIEILKYPNE